MNSIITANIDRVKSLCEQYKVSSLYAFGSVCSDRFNEASDIDLLISFKDIDPAEYTDNYFDLAEKLEDLFHKPVDLVTDKSLSNPYFIKSVNKSKVHIYG